MFSQETKTKLAQTLQKLKEAKEEGEQIRADCQAMIKQYQVNSFCFLMARKISIAMNNVHLNFQVPLHLTFLH